MHARAPQNKDLEVGGSSTLWQSLRYNQGLADVETSVYITCFQMKHNLKY